jgi:hypothetical protein
MKFLPFGGDGGLLLSGGDVFSRRGTRFLAYGSEPNDGTDKKEADHE